MKKFSRCVLILLLITILGGVGGFVIERMVIHDQYRSVSQLYVVPGDTSEDTLRADDGGLKDDFAIVFKSGVVISDAQKSLGTSEDISKYIEVNTPANSNIIELVCTYPDQNTAKSYVDAIAKTAVKTTTIIPVKSIQILTEGTSDGTAVKPYLYRNTAIIAGASAAACLVIEILVLLFMGAFKKKETKDDDNEQFIKQFKQVAPLLAMNNGVDVQPKNEEIIESEAPVDEIGEYLRKRNEERKAEKEEHEKWLKKQMEADEEDILAGIVAENDIPDASDVDSELEDHLAKQVAATMEETDDMPENIEEQVEESVEDNAEQPVEETVESNVEESVEKTAEQPVEETVEEPAEEPEEADQQETIEESMDDDANDILEDACETEKRISSSEIIGRIRR